jgi:hypothetical protein
MPPLPEAIIIVLGAFTPTFSRAIGTHVQVLLVEALLCQGPRRKSSHFSKKRVEEKPNLQKDDSKAKPYQVKQVRELILKYSLPYFAIKTVA